MSPPRPVLAPDGESYSSVSAAARATGLDVKAIHRRCQSGTQGWRFAAARGAGCTERCREALREDPYRSNSAIAEEIGCSSTLVASVRREGALSPAGLGYRGRPLGPGGRTMAALACATERELALVDPGYLAAARAFGRVLP